MDKISNRSINNIWSLLKVSKKDTRANFLFLTHTHTNFTLVLEDWNDGTGATDVNSSD